MSWDPSLGRPTKEEIVWNPWQEIASLFRARRAVRSAALSAGIIAGFHGAYALRYADMHRPVNTWFSHDPAVLSRLNFALCAAAAALGVAVYRRGQVWSAGALLTWAILEANSWLTSSLYGHVENGRVAGFSLALAILGFRGALALRRLSSEAEPDAAAPGA